MNLKIFILICILFEIAATAPTQVEEGLSKQLENVLQSIIAEKEKHNQLKTPVLNKSGKPSGDMIDVVPEEVESPNTLESDMKLSTEQLNEIEESVKSQNDDPTRLARSVGTITKRKAILHEKYRWPKEMIPYVLDDSLGKYKQAVLNGMKHIEDNTCVRFHPYDAAIASKLGHDDRVKIWRGSGCYSDIGKRGSGEQEVSIGNNCDGLGTVVHELMHTLGLYHEQSRPDRDQYVTVHTKNIEDHNVYNFNKYGHDEIKSFGVPYDLGSLMHYKGKYFAKQPDVLTIETKDPNMQSRIGQRERLSFIDAMVINNMYNCNDGCGNTGLTCENHGYIGPSCACVCPHGIAGPTCTDIAPTASPCGDVLTAPSGTFTTPGYPNDYGNNRDCNWLIQGPPGSTITLKFDTFDVEDDSVCYYDYVEIKKHGAEHAGPRFCGKGPQKEITYHGTNLVVMLHSDDSYTEKGFKATYEIQQTTRVDGGWSDWGIWTQCHKTCGLAHKLRVRHCNNPAPTNGGLNCTGEDIEFSTCDLPAC